MSANELVMCKHCNEYEVTDADVEMQTMRRQVAEMHELMTQFAAVMGQMQSHPMLAAFMPR